MLSSFFMLGFFLFCYSSIFQWLLGENINCGKHGYDLHSGALLGVAFTATKLSEEGNRTICNFLFSPCDSIQKSHKRSVYICVCVCRLMQIALLRCPLSGFLWDMGFLWVPPCFGFKYMCLWRNYTADSLKLPIHCNGEVNATDLLKGLRAISYLSLNISFLSTHSFPLFTVICSNAALSSQKAGKKLHLHFSFVHAINRIRF